MASRCPTVILVMDYMLSITFFIESWLALSSCDTAQLRVDFSVVNSKKFFASDKLKSPVISKLAKLFFQLALALS